MRSRSGYARVIHRGAHHAYFTTTKENEVNRDKDRVG